MEQPGSKISGQGMMLFTKTAPLPTRKQDQKHHKLVKIASGAHQPTL